MPLRVASRVRVRAAACAARAAFPPSFMAVRLPLNIELDHNEIYHALRKEEFHASILQMALEGAAKEEQVLLRSVQWHAYKPQVLHVDFQRVDANQALHTGAAALPER